MRLIDLSNEEARIHFLKGSSYFNGDMPNYISFEPLLKDVSVILNGGCFDAFKEFSPAVLQDVNYSFLTNKDGKFAWRPYELMHPVIYVSLVNLICEKDNWTLIKSRIAEFEEGLVDCCSAPVMSVDHQTDVATQIKSWWQSVEQRSLQYSLEFSHLLHTDVIDCYGSLYTHSIAWAIHGLEEAKTKKNDKSLLGNKIDFHISCSRYGQTNGIAQGSVLMDFIAEIVLGYADTLINKELENCNDIHILRYRDDYRIFANNDEKAESVLQIVSDKLRMLGMRLGVAKTILYQNVVEGSIKPDKLAGIDLQDLGTTNAKTIQKQLMRLHSFGLRYPNSGALKRLIGDFYTNISEQTEKSDDLEVQVAILTDIAYVSPVTFPAVAGILSHLISLVHSEQKKKLWSKVRSKMKRVPYNGYLEIWLQRIVQPNYVGFQFDSEELICRIVNGEDLQLWDSSWIACDALGNAFDAKKILVGNVSDATEVIEPKEIELFKQNAWSY